MPKAPRSGIFMESFLLWIFTLITYNLGIMESIDVGQIPADSLQKQENGTPPPIACVKILLFRFSRLIGLHAFAGELVGALVFGMAIVTAHPEPVDLVRRRG